MTSFRIRSTGQYPVSDNALRQLNPGISLPVTIDATAADLVGADIVATADQPTIPAGQMAVEGSPAQQPNGSWLQTWTLVALPAPTTISTWGFLNRFTATEQLAVQTACADSMTLQVGLTQALANGSVTFADPRVTAWMAGLVSAGAITAARATVLTTP
jgi:hypothetical protein